jgi:hypothetical protein
MLFVLISGRAKPTRQLHPAALLDHSRHLVVPAGSPVPTSGHIEASRGSARNPA